MCIQSKEGHILLVAKVEEGLRFFQVKWPSVVIFKLKKMVVMKSEGIRFQTVWSREDAVSN